MRKKPAKKRGRPKEKKNLLKNKDGTPSQRALDILDIARGMSMRKMAELSNARKTEFLKQYTGGNLKEVCDTMGIPKTTPYYWRKTDMAFRDDYEAIKNTYVEEDLENFLTSVGTGRVGTGKGYPVNMPNVTAAIFMAKAVNHDKYGEKVTKEERKNIKITTIEIHKNESTGKVTERQSIEERMVQTSESAPVALLESPADEYIIDE